MALIVGLPFLMLRAGEPSLRISGDVEHRLTLTAEALRRDFGARLQEIRFTEKGIDGTAHAFPLVELLKRASLKVDPLRKHTDFSLAVVAMADDGYSAVFSGAELSTELGHRGVWVAMDWNGKPLSGADSPVRLIVPGDAKPSRWVHGVRVLRVVNLAPKGHGPAPEKSGNPKG